MFRGFVTSLQKQNASSIKKNKKPPQKTNHPLQKKISQTFFFRNRLRRPLHPRASFTPRKPRLLPKTQKADSTKPPYNKKSAGNQKATSTFNFHSKKKQFPQPPAGTDARTQPSEKSARISVSKKKARMLFFAPLLKKTSSLNQPRARTPALSKARNPSEFLVSKKKQGFFFPHPC